MFARRNVLAASAAASFLASTGQSSAADDTPAACRASLARLFPNSLHHACALGRACAAQAHGESMPLDDLCGSDRRWIAQAPLHTLRTAINERIRADYAQGRTRRIDGWVLSRTEIELFTILAA